MGNTTPSIIRTLVPLVVGWLLSLPVTAALGVDQTTLTTLVTAGLAAAYYLLVRALEKRWPGLSVLLGSTKQPVYAAPGQLMPLIEGTVSLPKPEELARLVVDEMQRRGTSWQGEPTPEV